MLARDVPSLPDIPPQRARSLRKHPHEPDDPGAENRSASNDVRYELFNEDVTGSRPTHHGEQRP